MFVDPERKELYKYLRGIEGTYSILTGNFWYGLKNYIKYTILLML